MKTLHTALILVFAFAFLAGSAVTVDATNPPAADNIAWKPYGEAISSAKESGKKVIVDVYTDWCGWCKKMDKEVYAKEKIKETLEKYFEPVKLDAESKTSHQVDGKAVTERQIAKSFGVTGYPTTLFLDSDGEPITKVPGYIKEDMFVKLLEYIGAEHYKTKKWEEFAGM